MALTLGDNFSYQGAKPLDGRLKYDTVAAMKAMADSTLYDGCLAYCVATDKTYQWKSTNEVDVTLGRWREFESGASVTVDDELSDTSTNPVQNAVIKEALDNKADLVDGKVPAAQLPSYVDDVLEYEDRAHFPATGEAGKIYVALDTNKAYRWSGSAYTEISESLALGETSSTAYRGDRGKIAYDVSQTVGDVTNLKTANKSSVVAAINEVAGVNAHAGFTPVGTIISVMGVSAPANYLICNGQIVNIADYPELANYFEQQFGSKNKFGGDGTTTFAVPDLRGEFLRGTGTNGHGDDGGNGANVGEHQAPTVIPWIGAAGVSSKITVRLPNRTADNIGNYNADKYIYSTDSTRGRVRSDQLEWIDESSFSNYWYKASVRPTNTSVLYCIATKNIYIDARYNYSLEEQEVGTWIDGKPLYQKTVSTGGAVPSGATLIQRETQTGYDTIKYTKAS